MGVLIKDALIPISLENFSHIYLYAVSRIFLRAIKKIHFKTHLIRSLLAWVYRFEKDRAGNYFLYNKLQSNIKLQLIK